MFHIDRLVSPASAWERRLVRECQMEGRIDGGRVAEEEMRVPMQRWRALIRALDTHSLNLFITCYHATRNRACHKIEYGTSLGLFCCPRLKTADGQELFHRRS